MSDMVGNPEDRFSRVAAQVVSDNHDALKLLSLNYRAVTHSRIDSRIYGVSRYERYVTRTS